MTHKTVEEIWFFLSGRGAMWRRQGDIEEEVPVEAGVCITIPVGTHFQFGHTDMIPLRPSPLQCRLGQALTKR